MGKQRTPKEILGDMQRSGKSVISEMAVNDIICPYCGCTYISVTEIRTQNPCQYCCGNGKLAASLVVELDYYIVAYRDELLKLSLAELQYMQKILRGWYSFEMRHIIRAKEDEIRKASQ